jgi:hypothetical protein
MPWKIVAASVQGTSHTKTGTPCQDSHCFAQKDNILVGAVADGAGSASSAEIGSSVAAETFVSKITDLISSLGEISEHVAQSVVKQGVLEARAALERKAQEQSPGKSLRDFATTLIAFIATGEFVAAAQIGDGALVCLSLDNELFAITVPPLSEYINETTFLVSENWIDSLQATIICQKIKAIVAFSDGLQLLALKLPESIPYEPFFRPLFNFVLDSEDEAAAKAQVEAFLNSPRVNARTDDDKTLLLAGFR